MFARIHPARRPVLDRAAAPPTPTRSDPDVPSWREGFPVAHHARMGASLSSGRGFGSLAGMTAVPLRDRLVRYTAAGGRWYGFDRGDHLARLTAAPWGGGTP